MKIRLSTLWTFMIKFILPPTIFVGSLILASDLFSLLDYEVLFFLVWLTLVSVTIYYYGIRVKSVHLDDEYIYVSNFSKTLKVSLDNIKSVYENFPFSGFINIEFYEETAFGEKVVFWGYTVNFRFFTSHPAVKELRKRIKQKKEVTTSAETSSLILGSVSHQASSNAECAVVRFSWIS